MRSRRRMEEECKILLIILCLSLLPHVAFAADYSLPSEVETAARHCAYISPPGGNSPGHGTAVALGQGKLMLTADHVVAGCAVGQRMRVDWSPGSIWSTTNATVTYVWPESDLALLRLDEPSNLPLIEFASDVPTATELEGGNHSYRVFPVGFTSSYIEWQDGRTAWYVRRGMQGVPSWVNRCLVKADLSPIPPIWRIIDTGELIGTNRLTNWREGKPEPDAKRGLADVPRRIRENSDPQYYSLISNAWVTPGQSGGAAFNASGQVVGINSAVFSVEREPVIENVPIDRLGSVLVPVALVRQFLLGVDGDGKPHQDFIAAYRARGGLPELGHPAAHNGPIWLHGWDGVLIQNLVKPVGGDTVTGALIQAEGSSDVYHVTGAIWATYASSGGPARFGAPLEDEQDMPDLSGDRYQHFEKATFLWHRATGETEILPADWQPSAVRSGRIIATSLVIDVSGSMSGSKLAAVKDAVGAILRVARGTAQSLGAAPPPFAVATFSESVTEICAMTSDLDVVEQAVNALATEGRTDVGGGLSLGLTQARSAPGDERCIILLSDGQSNEGMPREALMDGLNPDNPAVQAAQEGISVLTIGFGSGYDDELLRRISAITGGGHYSAGDTYALTGMYLRASQANWGTTALDVSDTISQDERRDIGAFAVAREHNALRMVTSWPGSTVTGELTDPRGRTVAENYTGAEFVAGNPSVLIVKDPLPGEWQAAVIGTDCPHGSEPFDALVDMQEGERTRATGGGGGGGAGNDPLADILLVLAALVMLMTVTAVARRRQSVVAAKRNSTPIPPAPRWALVVTVPREAAPRLVPATNGMTIGRSPGNAVVLRDPLVSAKHARVVHAPRGWMIIDLQSRNGTFVGGRRIAGPTLLTPLEPIRIGSSTIYLHPVSADE